MRTDVATVAQLAEFDAVVDVRSPAEFAEDHVPGAINCPVLDDAERARVGTLYKQVSPFAARKVGAALVARNIARHVETVFMGHPRGWRPLVCCWRGGQRSGAMTLVLRQIGWEARQLDGGYRAFRRAVVADLETLPAALRFRVICGLTGSGKSRLLGVLAARGAQVLDLEGIAAHRGSLLGDLPDRMQPSQKAFESHLWAGLRRFDPRRPVFVESESQRIGKLRVPEALLLRMRAGTALRMEAALETRVALLMEEYAHFFERRELLAERLAALLPLHGHAVLNRWRAWIAAGDWATLVRELLTLHYDPAYLRSIRGHFPGYDAAAVIPVTGLDDYEAAASLCLDAVAPAGADA